MIMRDVYIKQLDRKGKPFVYETRFADGTWEHLSHEYANIQELHFDLSRNGIDEMPYENLRFVLQGKVIDLDKLALKEKLAFIHNKEWKLKEELIRVAEASKRLYHLFEMEHQMSTNNEDLLYVLVRLSDLKQLKLGRMNEVYSYCVSRKIDYADIFDETDWGFETFTRLVNKPQYATEL
tara:strand:- start:1609 stop:2148 length:540 start_codon:yes stop_codon:yes gene_type:complete